MTNYGRILMTGASGFVGRKLALALQSAYPTAACAALVRDSSETIPGWKTFCVDLLDPVAVCEALRGWEPALVLHLAAQSSVGQARNCIEETWRINAVGALNLAAAVGRTVPEAFVFNVSTGEVYGSSFLHGPASETTPVSPVTVYARSKLAAERIFEDVLPPETRLVTVRPLNHTGIGQDERFALPSFAAQIARIEAGLVPPKLRVGDVGVERDFLDVRDVIDAYLLILARADSLPRRSLFNVASELPHRIGDLLDLMARASTCRFDIEIDPTRFRPAEIPRVVGDARALRRDFGWTPKHSIDRLVIELLTYWRSRISAEGVGGDTDG